MLVVPNNAAAQRRSAVVDTCAVGSRAVLCITHLHSLFSEGDMAVRCIAVACHNVVQQRVAVYLEPRLMTDRPASEDRENRICELQDFFEVSRIEDNRQ